MSNDQRFAHIHARKTRVYFDIESVTPGAADPKWPEKISLVMATVETIIKARNLDWCIMDSSRLKSDGSYKNSTHLVARDAFIEDNTSAMQRLCELIKLTLTPKAAASLFYINDKGASVCIIDASVCTKNRNMRCLFGRKAPEDENYMRACHTAAPFRPFTEEEMSVLDPVQYDSLIMAVPRQGAVFVTYNSMKKASGLSDELDRVGNEAKRARHMPPVRIDLSDKSRSSSGSMSPLECSPETHQQTRAVWEALNKWLSVDPTSIGMEWNGSSVLNMLEIGKNQLSIIFRVGFDAKGVSHSCPAKTDHSGDCSQTWLVWVNLVDFSLSCGCWSTQEGDNPCGRDKRGKQKWNVIYRKRKTVNDLGGGLKRQARLDVKMF